MLAWLVVWESQVSSGLRVALVSSVAQVVLLAWLVVWESQVFWEVFEALLVVWEPLVLWG